MQFNHFEPSEWVDAYGSMPHDQLFKELSADLETHMEVVGYRLKAVGYPMELWSQENQFARFICSSFYYTKHFHTPPIPRPFASLQGYTVPRVHEATLSRFRHFTQFPITWQWLQCTQGEEWWPHAHSWVVHDGETLMLAMQYEASRNHKCYLEAKKLGRPKTVEAVIKEASKEENAKAREQREEQRRKEAEAKAKAKAEKAAAAALVEAERERKRVEREEYDNALQAFKEQRKREKQEFLDRNEAKAKELKAKALELRLESDRLYAEARRLLALRP